MASRKFPEGEKSNLRDLLDGYGTPTELYKYTGSLPPSSPSTKTIESIEGTAAPRKRVRPGLGEPGLERIKESLAEFRDEPPDSGPPEEPPVEEGFDREDLPKPEYVYPINQSTKASFKTSRPDKYYEFWRAAASQQSTRVYAMQWIPTHREYGVTIGDIFVAFARPSKGKKSLFVYKKKKQEEWDFLKIGGEEGSFGKTINTMGKPDDYDDALFSEYEEIHVGHTEWIFKSMGKWGTIRPNNESTGSDKADRERGALSRSIAAKEAEFEKAKGKPKK